MVLLISSILESVFNPSERFSTLKGLEVRGTEDDVVLGFSRGVLKLKVFVGKQRWILSCRVDTDKSVLSSQTDLINGLSGVDKKYLTPIRSLEREMLVFDECGHSYNIDVLLTRDIEGETFSQAIISAYADRDSARFDKLRKDYTELVCNFVSESSTEFKLRPEDVSVDSDTNLRVVNYELGVHAFQRHLAFALVMVLMRSDIPFKMSFRSMSSFPAAALRNYLSVLYRVAVSEGYDVLSHACQLLEQATTVNIKPSEMCDLLTELAGLNIVCGENSHWSNEVGDIPKTTLDVLLNDYDYFSRLECNLITVEKQGKWGYVDACGRVMIPLEYDWAGDFDGGYAVVMRDDLYGLIDDSNNTIVPIEYEDLEWNSLSQTIIASVDGYFGLLDIQASTVVPFEYRWLSAASETMLVASQQQKYGYIDLSGNQIVPFIYDDAYAFNGGRALVVQGTEQFHIDEQGRRL